MVYRPKTEIALELYDRAVANGIHFAWLTFDEWYGVNAVSDGSLCERFHVFTAIVVAHAGSDLGRREQSLGLDDGLLAVRPLRLDRVQPRALHRQEARHEHQAWCRWRALQANAKYQAIPELQAALGLLERAKFGKMIAYLRSPVSRRVRTNNHVERCNPKLRYWEKVRYKWRRRRTLVRFLVLALDHWWKKVLISPPTAPTDTTSADEVTSRTRHRPSEDERSVSRCKAA